ncbi:hypothetical protein HAX54_020641 [Datura stramonium]|uniref:AT-hook motif nuclear-localized protein n=1 Tax=Datura stramonium TaxID=4076 RepID=A0ABS8S3E9_DATST|nr:hypothetical protein [Datura stramonium]
MDRREAMMLPGSAPYYMQRGMSGAGMPLVYRNHQVLILHYLLPFNLVVVVASIPQTLVMDPSSTISPRGSIGASSAPPQGEPVRRKRGRPRKRGVEEGHQGLDESSNSLLLSSQTTACFFLAVGYLHHHDFVYHRVSSSIDESCALAYQNLINDARSIGIGTKFFRIASTVDGCPIQLELVLPACHAIAVGEDITTKIMSFSQQGPRSMMHFIRQMVSSPLPITVSCCLLNGGQNVYGFRLICRKLLSFLEMLDEIELFLLMGRFEILCLSGSFLVNDSGGSRGRVGSLSISLASPDGRVIGGGVGGVLIAASPIQTTDNSVNPADALSNQNLTPSSSIGVWPSSRQMDLQTGHIDIDLMRG